MSTDDAGNPYSIPQPAPQYSQNVPPQDYGFQALNPLFEATWWLKLLGWSLIIIGGLYCLTIVGIIFGWLPIWMGFLLKGAGEKISFGYQSRNWQSMFDGTKDLKTFFIITGVLMLINLIILVLYFLFFVVFIVIGVVAGASSAASGL